MEANWNIDKKEDQGPSSTSENSKEKQNIILTMLILQTSSINILLMLAHF